MEIRLIRRLALQGGLRCGVAPWLVGDASESQACVLDRAAFEFQRGRDRDERECIGQPIADFQVGIVRGESARRKFDRDDDLVRPQIGVDMGRLPGKPMEIE